MNESLQMYGHWNTATKTWKAWVYSDYSNGNFLRFAFEYEARAALRDYPKGHDWRVEPFPLTRTTTVANV